MRTSVAFCPSGISSFFEVCDHDAAGNLITDPARIGARGGGFALTRGATSRVTIRKSSRARIEIKINAKPAPEAQTTRSAIEQLMKTKGLTLDVVVAINIRVPISAGFGTSAAGTIASCLALSDAADLPVSLNELARITHVADVVNKTGLGTAAALLCGGFVWVREPGAPGIGVVDRLRFPPHHSIVCAYLGPIETKEALANRAKNGGDRRAAQSAIRAIRANPTLSTFLAESRKFGAQAGFETPRVTRLILTMEAAGVVGAAQNMIGEAVHAVVETSKATKVAGTVRGHFPRARVFISPLDNQGVRLTSSDAKH